MKIAKRNIYCIKKLLWSPGEGYYTPNYLSTYSFLGLLSKVSLREFLEFYLFKPKKFLVVRLFLAKIPKGTCYYKEKEKYISERIKLLIEL